jgi:GT2 family glycosyltransferase
MNPAEALRYTIPQGTIPVEAGGHPALQLPGGGRVAVDEWVQRCWAQADGHSLGELVVQSQSPDLLRTALACLAEGGLLERSLPDAQPQAAGSQSGPLVSVVIVAYEGKAWLQECLPSLAAQTYAPIEVLVYDNASPSLAMQLWVGELFPQVRYLRGETPLSFAAANNLAIQQAQGEYLLLLNQDVRLDPQAVAELVTVAARRTDCAAVAAKLRFWWAPRFLNGLGNAVRDHSWGTDIGFGQLDLGQFDDLERLPSACFAAALIPRPAWQQVGPIDARFPMYYEDSEWCYRARALGRQVYAAPRAVVYHAFGGRVPSGEAGGLATRKLANAIYGRLRFALKLLYPPARNHFLAHYLREDLRNALAAVARLRLGQLGAFPRAYLHLARDFKDIYRQHQQLSANLANPNVTALAFDPPDPLDWNGLPRLDQAALQSVYLPLILSKRTRLMPEFTTETRRPNLLLVSNDVIDAKMAGPGARYVEMARALSASLEVTLAAPNPTTLTVPGLRIVSYREDRPESLEVLVQNHEQALISGYMVLKFPFLKKIRTRLIVDWYDPFFLENYYYYLDEPRDDQLERNAVAIGVVNDLARIGDFFICGNERQRDLWIGILAANQRINPLTLKDDETLRKLIDVVGVGIPERPLAPHSTTELPLPAFPPESRVVLWGGGIWNWLDPLTLVDAWPAVLRACPNARLVFLGTRHPNPNVPPHEIVERLIRRAEASGEKDRSIFFIEWLPYEEREALLQQAHVGVTLHPIHAETRYSIRTRVLDYFWANLPVCITEGDVTSEWVRSYRVGRAVPVGDAEALAAALIDLLDREKAEFAPGFAALREQMAWSRVVEPLRRFALQGANAPDRAPYQRSLQMDPQFPPEVVQGTLRRAAYLWATQGTQAMLARTIYHIKYVLGKR